MAISTIARLPIDLDSKLLQNTVMPIKETRLKNLQMLWHAASARGILQKDFAKQVGTSPNAFNQYLTKNRNVGDQMARRIEGKLKLAHGWIDQPHPEEWESMARTDYDGRMRSANASRATMAVAARLELLDDRDVEEVLHLIEHFEQSQARREGIFAALPKPKTS